MDAVTQGGQLLGRGRGVGSGRRFFHLGRGGENLVPGGLQGVLGGLGMLDGIILESRRCLTRLHGLGLPQGDVRVAWRGADPWFCQRRADATDKR